MHLTVPHGLEQYTGAAWGTRDVCQGPVEFLLALEHDEPVKEILRIVFAQQHESRGRLAAMVHARALRRDPGSATAMATSSSGRSRRLCDYVEATNDLAFLDEPVAWRRDDAERTAREDPVAAHVDKLLATVPRAVHPRHQPDPLWRGRLERLAAAGRPAPCATGWSAAGRWRCCSSSSPATPRSCAGPAGEDEASGLDELAAAMRADLNRHLVRDGILAGYAMFDPDGGTPELLLHPSDTRTGLHYSLLPMKRAIIAGLFTDGAGRAPPPPHPRPPAVPRRCPADGQARGLPRRHRSGSSAAPNRRRSSAARSA